MTYPAGRIRRLLPVECERIQGFPEEWTLVPSNNGYGDADKVDTLRYNALGNAVTVPVAEWLATRIKRHLAKRKSSAATSSDRRGRRGATGAGLNGKRSRAVAT